MTIQVIDDKAEGESGDVPIYPVPAVPEGSGEAEGCLVHRFRGGTTLLPILEQSTRVL